MAELIREANELPTIRLSLGLETSKSGPAPTVQLEVDRGTQVCARMTLRSEDLNLPAQLEPAGRPYWEPRFEIAPRLWPAIQRPVRLAMGASRMLWLELTPPVGHLAVLPWELMFAPVLGEVPIIRTPNFTLFTPLGAEQINVVLCLSEPAAKEPFDSVGFLRDLVPKLFEAAPQRIVVHVFADAATYEQLRLLPASAFELHSEDVVLHDPALAPVVTRATGEGSMSDPAGAVSNPWLLWITEEMRGSTVEVVHFITHGYLRSGQSALALAESPTVCEDTLWSRFIGPNQVAAFLAQVGAWAVGFTSPPLNYSRMGLRQMFDDVARLRAGPVLHHESLAGSATHELGDAYATLFWGDQPMFGRTISMYAHPALFAGHDSADFDSYADTLVRGTPELEPAAGAPAWVTSTQRYLEQAVASIFPDQSEPGSELQRAAGQGLEDLLMFVREVARDVGGLDR